MTHTETVRLDGGSIWQVSVNDGAVAEDQLLRAVLEDPAIIVTAFSRKKFELEEVFMEIVKGIDNDR